MQNCQATAAAAAETVAETVRCFSAYDLVELLIEMTVIDLLKLAAVK